MLQLSFPYSIRNKKCETIKKEEVIDFSLILYLVSNLHYPIFSQVFLYSYTKLYFWLCDELELYPVASITEINFLAQLRWQFKIEEYDDFKRLLLKLHYINGNSSYYLYTISDDLNPEEKDFEKLTKKEIGCLIETLEDYEDMRVFLINNRNYIMSWDYYFEDEDTE